MTVGRGMTWIKGSYDQLLRVLFNWWKFYDQGRVVSFRKVLNGTEEFVGIQPTERAVQLELTDAQFRAVVDLMEKLYPGTVEAKFLRDYYHKSFPKGRLVNNNKRLITISMPKHTVKSILHLFMEFKAGVLDWKPRNILQGKPIILEPGTTTSQGLFAEFGEEEETVEEGSTSKAPHPDEGTQNDWDDLYE